MRVLPRHFDTLLASLIGPWVPLQIMPWGKIKRISKLIKKKKKPCNLKATMGNKGLARNWLGPFFLEVTVQWSKKKKKKLFIASFRDKMGIYILISAKSSSKMPPFLKLSRDTFLFWNSILSKLSFSVELEFMRVLWTWVPLKFSSGTRVTQFFFFFFKV